MKLQKAFSLVELSLAVLIIGVATLVALNGKSLFTKANCVVSSFGSKTITDNLDNPSALTVNRGTSYENCVNPPPSSVIAFSPSSISGLKLWFDASDSSTTFSDNAGTIAASNNSTVCNWKDKSGNNYNATASGGNCPTYKSALQNGLNGVYFNGANYLTNGTFSSQAANATIFIVCNYSLVSAANNVFSAASGSWAYYYNSSQLFRYFYSSFIITSNTSVGANNYRRWS